MAKAYGCLFLSCFALLGQITPSYSAKLIYDEDGDTYAPSAQKAMKQGHAPARLMSQFATSIECATGRSPILDYGNYGCFCGLGGKGVPVDATDKCCQIHDDCYHKTRTNSLCATKIDVMLRWYAYRSDRCGTADVDFTCKLPNQYGLFERLLSGANPTCAHAVCECDKAAALCFMRAEFNPLYRMYNKLLMCGTKPDITGLIPDIPGLKPGTGAGLIPDIPGLKPGTGAGLIPDIPGLKPGTGAGLIPDIPGLNPGTGGVIPEIPGLSPGGGGNGTAGGVIPEIPGLSPGGGGNGTATQSPNLGPDIPAANKPLPVL